MSAALKFYQRLLSTHPVKVTAIQTAFLMGTGDCIAQLVVEEKTAQQYSLVRTAKFASFGLVSGPILRAWYGLLDRWIKSVGIRGAFTKMAADQLMFAPAFVVVFVSTMGALNGEKVQDIKKRLDRDALNILITNYKVWPAVQVANFSLVPLQHRVLVVQFVAIFWNTFLAFVSNKPTVAN